MNIETNCAAPLMEVMLLVTRTLRAEMRRQGALELSVPQFRTLAFLSRNAGASLSEAAEHVGLTLSSTSRLIEGLVARGLVTREASLEDRRYLVLAVTEAGRALLESARAASLAKLAGMLEGLTAEEQEHLTQSMRLIRPLFEA